MNLQSYFDMFNDSIRMDFNKKKELEEKREILISKLKCDDKLPSFTYFNQGSYAMYTGIKPVGDEDYDIDVALCFDVTTQEYKPTQLKAKVYEVIKNHTEYGAKVKEPCVTIYYKKDGDIAFHVDFAIYVKSDSEEDESIYYLDRGKLSSEEENKYWECAQPKELKKLINDKVEDTEKRKQYRRIIRYLKRWNKENCNGYSVPGIGLTLLVYEYFFGSSYDKVSRDFVPDDLVELMVVVEKILNRFSWKYDTEKNEILHYISYFNPVKPGKDIFYKMSISNQNKFYNELKSLKSKLQEVYDEYDIVKQCEILRKVFGEDFPVPEKKDVSEKQVPVNPPTASDSGCYEL
jgi:hypothetical protein